MQRKKIADALLLATGSEVNLAVEAQKALEGEGIDACCRQHAIMGSF